MTKLPNRHGGGAQTNINGLNFERSTSLNNALKIFGYEIVDDHVYLNNIKIGISAPQNKIYKLFLEPRGINYKDYNSKGWKPDEVFINFNTSTVYIIEKKFQNVSGSVDEKLPNCHFKKLEYEKLCNPINFSVEFAYILSDWFEHPQYKDTLEYIENMGCHYFFNTIPLGFLGLQTNIV